MALLKDRDIVVRKKAKTCTPPVYEEIYTQEDMKKRIQHAKELHNKRAESILKRFSDLPVFQDGGALQNLVVFR